ncbi:MAG: NAD(+)/NADH kinase [Anaerolineae bacterium]|nr:NAD(+)/NADH kinase [Anaerolineae bacterium]
MAPEEHRIQSIGLVYNARVERSLPLAREVLAWLENRGIDAWSCAISEHAKADAPADLLITLGGDGSILRVAQRAAPAGIPILGINLGRVGFLTETTPDHWRATLEGVLRGKCSVESRMMLCVTLVRDGQAIAQEQALNDAVVSRGALARTVRLHTAIDGALMTRYVADALILATPTGSTAYAYAVGGPILPPWVSNIVVVPAAPHLSMERPLVLDAQSVVEVEVETQIPGMLSVDGRMEGELLNGDVVRIEQSAIRTRFLRLRDSNDFYKTLVDRLTPRNGVP